jgi:hypothetical protein
MIEVYLSKSGDWKAVSEPINNTDKLEWFESLEGWKKTEAPIALDGETRKCEIYLSSPKHGWVPWHTFTPPIV